MRSRRSWAVLVALCLLLGTAVASATEAPSAPARREASGIARILGQLGAFLKAVWENEAGQIDPWGGCSPGAGAPATEASPAPSSDEAGHIDPLG